LCAIRAQSALEAQPACEAGMGDKVTRTVRLGRRAVHIWENTESGFATEFHAIRFGVPSSHMRNLTTR
jgi:hypothetical protein